MCIDPLINLSKIFLINAQQFYQQYVKVAKLRGIFMPSYMTLYAISSKLSEYGYIAVYQTL